MCGSPWPTGSCVRLTGSASAHSAHSVAHRLLCAAAPGPQALPFLPAHAQQPQDTCQGLYVRPCPPTLACAARPPCRWASAMTGCSSTTWRQCLRNLLALARRLPCTSALPQVGAYCLPCVHPPQDSACCPAQGARVGRGRGTSMGPGRLSCLVPSQAHGRAHTSASASVCDLCRCAVEGYTGFAPQGAPCFPCTLPAALSLCPLPQHLARLYRRRSAVLPMCLATVLLAV